MNKNPFINTFISWFRQEAPSSIRLFDVDTLFLAIVTCFWYLTAYLLHPATPSNAPDGPLGWLASADQKLYYKTTVDLANGHLLPSVYWFGYPLLGAAFYWLLPRQPWLIPDLVLVLFMVGAFFASARLFMTRLEAWALVLIAIYADSILRDMSLVIPWNTMPEYAAFYICTYLLILTRATLPKCGICALFCGLAAYSRPTEAEFLGILYLSALFDFKDWTKRAWAAALLASTYAIAFGLTLASNLYFYHELSSPYIQGLSTRFNISNFPLKVYQFLLDGNILTEEGSVHPHSHQILELYWPFIFIVPGSLFLWRIYRWKAVGLFGAIIGIFIYYILYNDDTNIPQFWTFCNPHYIWFVLPWLSLITYLSFRCAPWVLTRKAYVAALLFPLLLIGIMGYKPVTVASSSSGQGTGLTLSATYAARTSTIRFTAPRRIDAEDIRITFKKTPSFHGTLSGTVEHFDVTINGHPQLIGFDYYPSQSGSHFNLCFLVHGLHLETKDEVVVRLMDTDEPLVDEATIIGVTYAPLSAIAHFVQDDLLTAESR